MIYIDLLVKSRIIVNSRPRTHDAANSQQSDGDDRMYKLGLASTLYYMFCRYIGKAE